MALRKGQFFSADVVIAFVSITFALGVLLHTSQLLLDNLNQYTRHENNAAEMIAGGMAHDPYTLFNFTILRQGSPAYDTTCWMNRSGALVTESNPACATVASACKNNNREIFAATRLYPCGVSGYCVITVKTCLRVIDG